jgi:hypothetical protein
LTQETQQKKAHVIIDAELLDSLKARYPETKRLTYTGLADWGLRKLLSEGKQ